MIKLIKFELERYPGSQSLSSYASDVEAVSDAGEILKRYKIYMNHPLNFEGFKFFQSSYDTDELGSVLEVNRDPGKIPTYIGYFLLCVGVAGNFFTRQSRFLRLINFIKNSRFSLIAAFIALTFLNFNANAQERNESEILKTFAANTAVHAKGAFAELLVQDYMGRIKPLSTEASEIVNKISGADSLYGLSAEQMVLGMNINPAFWQELKIIKVKNAQIKKLLNLDGDYASFRSVFDANGEYKLAAQVEAANEKPLRERGTLDNDLIKFDERLNIAYLTFKGAFFKFIPIPNDPQNAWLSPNDAFNNEKVGIDVKSALNDYLTGLQEGIADNDWSKADAALAELKNYQRAASGEILPSERRIEAEVFYNHVSIFKKLVYFYWILGFSALGLGLASVFLSRRILSLERAIFAAFTIGFAVHTAALALRWYISGHAPWSDSYESMIYIGWSGALAGMIFFRRSLLALAAAALLAGIVMLVAHMSFVNPQITNLVPVLKSYWLSIHVSVITASYGFLGLGCLLGLIALGLMAFKNKANEVRLNEQIRYIAAIDEASLIIGICLLTLGNFFGGIWANESWGRYWGWDSKETWSYVSILVYAIVLHLRLIPRLNSLYVFLTASVFAYASIVMTYFGVNFYLTGMHSYAGGDQPQMSNLVYLALGFVLLATALAFKGRDVKTI